MDNGKTHSVQQTLTKILHNSDLCFNESQKIQTEQQNIKDYFFKMAWKHWEILRRGEKHMTQWQSAEPEEISREQHFNLKKCPHTFLLWPVMSCPIGKTPLSEQSLSLMQRPENWKLAVDFNTSKSIWEPQCTAVSKNIKVQFQVSSCVKSEVPEIFLHHYFLHHCSVTRAKTA